MGKSENNPWNVGKAHVFFENVHFSCYIEYFRGGCCLLLSYTYALCYTNADGCACTVLLTLPLLQQYYLNICLFIWLCIYEHPHMHTHTHSLTYVPKEKL